VKKVVIFFFHLQYGYEYHIVGLSLCKYNDVVTIGQGTRNKKRGFHFTQQHEKTS